MTNIYLSNIVFGNYVKDNFDYSFTDISRFYNKLKLIIFN